MTSPSEPPVARPDSFDEWLQAFREQASFFTGLRFDVGAPRWQLADVLPVLPVIGAAIGFAAGLVFAIGQALGTGWLGAVLAVATVVLLTRALHEDGLADTADGLGPHGIATERRLEIMRDSRNGTFGVLALALSVLAKVGCLAGFGGGTGLVVLIGAHAVSRAAIAYPLLAFGPAQANGLGVRVGKPTDNDVWATIAIGMGLAFVLLLGKVGIDVQGAHVGAVHSQLLGGLARAQQVGGVPHRALGQQLRLVLEQRVVANVAILVRLPVAARLGVRHRCVPHPPPPRHRTRDPGARRHAVLLDWTGRRFSG